MNTNDLMGFIKNTERMVDPSRVAQINQFSGFMGKLPLKWQKKIAYKGAEKNPYMGFIVEPYSFFLSYEITHKEAVKKLIPEDYRLVPTSIFNTTRVRPSVIVGAFNVHTSVFWGSRVEVYVIAEHKKSGLLSWIIVDYLSNTNSYDPGQGFIGSTTSQAVITTSYRGDVIVDVQALSSDKKMTLNAPLRGAAEETLNRRLWVEGNLSVDYGGELKDGDSEPFGLIFDPHEMDRANRIALENVHIDSDSLVGPYTAPKPFEAASFPFAQHFITTGMPVSIGLKTEKELEKAAEKQSLAS